VSPPASRHGIGKATWWDSLFGPSSSRSGGTAGEPIAVNVRAPVSATSVLPPGAWQSKPVTSKAQKNSERPAAEGSPQPSLPEALGPPTRSTGQTLADGFAAGLQEGLSSISQLTGYFQTNLRRRSWASDTSSVQEASDGGKDEVLINKDATGTWQIIWKDIGTSEGLQTLTFEASAETRGMVQAMVRPAGNCLQYSPISSGSLYVQI
jgi:hypothetical protein